MEMVDIAQKQDFSLEISTSSVMKLHYFQGQSKKYNG